MANDCFPQPESHGGWPCAQRQDLPARGWDAEALADLCRWNMSIQAADPAKQSHIGFLVIHEGAIVAETYFRESDRDCAGQIASVGKSISACAFGQLIEAGVRGELAANIDLNSKVYERRYLPEGFPLSDPRKETIDFAHLFTHTSGIQPEPDVRDGAGFNFVDYTVGKCAAYPASGRLAFDPGASFGYSSVALNHLSLIVPHLTGEKLHCRVARDIFRPIGIESAIWRKNGTYAVPAAEPLDGYEAAAGGPHMTTRDLARFAYLCLRRGGWEGRSILSSSYLDMARLGIWFNADQPRYFGLGMLTNVHDGLAPELPRNAFCFAGSGTNVALIVPEWDVVAVRTSRVWTMDVVKEHIPQLASRLSACHRSAAAQEHS